MDKTLEELKVGTYENLAMVGINLMKKSCIIFPNEYSRTRLIDDQYGGAVEFS